MSQIHATTEKLTLVAVPQPDGKVRITSNSWDDPVVLLPRGDACPALGRPPSARRTTCQDFGSHGGAEPRRRFEGAPGRPLSDSEEGRSWRGGGPSDRCTPFIRTLRKTVSSGKSGRCKDGKVRQSDRDQAARAGLPRLSHRCRSLESFIAGRPSTPASSRRQRTDDR